MRVYISLVPWRLVEFDPASEIGAVRPNQCCELPGVLGAPVLVVQIAGDHLGRRVEMLVRAAVGFDESDPEKAVMLAGKGRQVQLRVLAAAEVLLRIRNG